MPIVFTGVLYTVKSFRVLFIPDSFFPSVLPYLLQRSAAWGRASIAGLHCLHFGKLISRLKSHDARCALVSTVSWIETNIVTMFCAVENTYRFGTVLVFPHVKNIHELAVQRRTTTTKIFSLLRWFQPLTYSLMRNDAPEENWSNIVKHWWIYECGQLELFIYDDTGERGLLTQNLNVEN